MDISFPWANITGLDSRLRGNDNKKSGNDNKKNGNDNKKNGNDKSSVEWFQPASVEWFQPASVESFQPHPISRISPNYKAERTTHDPTLSHIPTPACSPFCWEIGVHFVPFYGRNDATLLPSTNTQ